MKILWLADYTVKEHKGGAQQTNDVMIKEGIAKGHKIDIVTSPEVLEKDYDLVVLNNIAKFSKEYIERVLEDYKRVVRYEHDYWVADHYPELYRKVGKTILLSPLHKKTVEEKIGYEVDNYKLVPSPINPKMFKAKRREKEKNSVLYAGQLSEDKGIYELKEFILNNQNLHFYIVGWGEGSSIFEGLENVDLISEVNQSELVGYYQRCRYFYHRPRWKEPFGRTVMEAYLCGCSLLVNSNVGAMSWDWDFGNYNEVKKNLQSGSKFWNILENEVSSFYNLE